MSADYKLKNIIEAALLAAGKPLSLDHLQELFLEEERPEKKAMREVIKLLQEDYSGRGIEVVEVAGGFRINVNQDYSPWVSRLWEERPARYSRALLETLSLIAYRQPITRGEIEDIRGVSVSSNIMKTLLEREWVRVVGQRDVPGRPSLYATTREFLNYFSLKSLDELPTLAEIRDLDSINRELELEDPNGPNGEEDLEQADIRSDIAEGDDGQTAVEANEETDSEQGDIPPVTEVDDVEAEVPEALISEAPETEAVVDSQESEQTEQNEIETIESDSEAEDEKRVDE